VVRSEHVNRREALQRLAAGAVGAAAAGGWVESLSALSQAHAHRPATAAVMSAQAWKPRLLTPAQNEAVIAITELIIPETDTPGARAVGVNRFVDRVLQDASRAERTRFFRGLAWMDEQSRKVSGKGFAASPPAEQTALLTRIADEDNAAEADRRGVEFFRAIKSMTISGYYTSEIGLRRELGDDGQLAVEQFVGCDHPEHGGRS
jgi:hypothetical protein